MIDFYKRNSIKYKWEKDQPLPKVPIKKPEEEEFKPSQSISTKFLNKSTQTSEFQRKPWTSWTLSSTTLSTESPLKDQNSLDSTKEELFHPDKSNQLSNLSSQENLPDTLFLKELKPSLNTFNNDINRLLICALFLIFSLKYNLSSLWKYF